MAEVVPSVRFTLATGWLVTIAARVVPRACARPRVQVLSMRMSAVSVRPLRWASSAPAGKVVAPRAPTSAAVDVPSLLIRLVAGSACQRVTRAAIASPATALGWLSVTEDEVPQYSDRLGLPPVLVMAGVLRPHICQPPGVR